MKKILSIALLLLMAMPGVFAQKVLTLEECIDIALQNNIALKRARNSAEIARAQYT